MTVSSPYLSPEAITTSPFSGCTECWSYTKSVVAQRSSIVADGRDANPTDACQIGIGGPTSIAVNMVCASVVDTHDC
jgi:hypothetical protein